MEIIEKWLDEVIYAYDSKDISESEKKKAFERLEQQYNSFSTDEQKKIYQIVSTAFEVNESIFILSLIKKNMNIKDINNELLSVIQKGKFDCFVGSMLESQVISYDDISWRKLFLLHRKNVQRFRECLDVYYPYLSYENRNKNRIVITTEQFLGTLHAPTKLVCDFAYILQKYLGYEVLLFVLPSDYYLDQGIYHAPKFSTSYDKFKEEKINLKYKDIIISGYQINMSSPLAIKEYNMMLFMIYAYNPAFVLNMGVFNPIADVMKEFVSVVTMGMTTKCPVSSADIIIRLGRVDEEMEKEYSKYTTRYHQKQIFIEERIPVLMEIEDEVCTREELLLPEDKFLVAIVGNRLDQEISDEFISVMKEITNILPSVVFVIIGELKEKKQNLLNSVLGEQIIFLGFCKNLSNVYSCIDLYLNPKRTGGGYSSTMALKRNVPVITLPECDVAYNVGDAFVVADYKQMIERIHCLVGDEEYYLRMKELTENARENDGEIDMKNYVQKMITRIQEVIEE